MWSTRGWQLVLGATQSLPIWQACEEYERAILAEEQRLTAQTPSPDSVPRGRKRQAVDNLEHTRVEHMLEHMLQHFSEMDVSTTPGLRDLPASQQQDVLDGLVHTLTTDQDALRHAVDQSAPLDTSPPPHSSNNQPVSNANDLPVSPAAAGVDIPVRVRVSASMSLTSSSTSPPTTLPPPYPSTTEGHD